jgi:hypothetical protein
MVSRSNWARYVKPGVVTFLMLVVLPIIGSCSSEPSSRITPAVPANSPISVLPAPSPVIDHYTKSYTTTMSLPDGRALPMYCTYTGMESHCRAVFPNGEIMPASIPPEWSPDGKFALVCGSYTSHGTPCTSYGVCDLVGEKCDNYFVTTFHRWHPGAPHTLAYFYLSSYLGLPDQVVVFDPETGNKQVFFDTCPDWFYRDFPGLCELLPTIIIQGRLKNLPDDVVIRTMVCNLDGDAHFGPMRWTGEGVWSSNLRNSPGKVFEVTAEAEGYTSVPLSYTIQVSGAKAYVVVDGQLTPDEANHLDFHFEKKE